MFRSPPPHRRSGGTTKSKAAAGLRRSLHNKYLPNNKWKCPKGSWCRLRACSEKRCIKLQSG